MLIVGWGRSAIYLLAFLFWKVSYRDFHTFCCSSTDKLSQPYTQGWGVGFGFNIFKLNGITNFLAFGIANTLYLGAGEWGV